MDVHNWRSILLLVVFIIANLLVSVPVRVPIPRIISSFLVRLFVRAKIINPFNTKKDRYGIPLDFKSVPLIGTLILLAAGSLKGDDIRKGILGANGIKPIDIMALFISLAYMSISLDTTGLFRYLAFWVARKGGSSGKKLYTYLYLFFLISGAIFGNDPIILSGTPFLAYLTRISNIDPPTAWVFSQFTAANIASMLLVPSNPTNLVLTGGFNLTFTSYTAHMILPFLACSLFAFPVLLLRFRSRPRFTSRTSPYIENSSNLSPPSTTPSFEPELIPKELALPDDVREEANSALKDQKGAVFGGTLMLATLGVLVGTSTIRIAVWQVTVPPALLVMGRDVWSDLSKRRKEKKANKDSRVVEAIAMEDRKDNLKSEELESTPKSTKESLSAPLPVTLSSIFRTHVVTPFQTHLPTLSHIIPRLPLSLLPFAFLMFTLVQGLVSAGWVEVFAHGWAWWAGKTGVVGAVGGMVFLGCLLCNICGTNIGTTILLTRVILAWVSLPNIAVPKRSQLGAIYALAISSNIGALNLTFAASLAGLLWRGILADYGIRVGRKEFAWVNVGIVGLVAVVGGAVLVGEVRVLYR